MQVVQAMLHPQFMHDVWGITSTRRLSASPLHAEIKDVWMMCDMMVGGRVLHLMAAIAD